MGTQKCWLLSQGNSILRYLVAVCGSAPPILHLSTFVYFLCFFALTISDYSSFSNPMFLLLQLKKRLQILTLGIGGVGLVSAYISYSPEIAAR